MNARKLWTWSLTAALGGFLFSFDTAEIFPGLTAALGPAATCGFFALAMVLQLVWVRRVMPETKGVSLEELQTRLQR